MRFQKTLVGLGALAVPVATDLPMDHPSGAFVHLFEWKWSDVAQECEQWLGPKGFTAVQISPPNEHVTGPAWWTRYQPVTYKLISRSGDEAEFTDMVKRCKAAGVDIYADSVINHCAAGDGTGVAGSTFGGRQFPTYGPNDFHHNPGDVKSNCAVTNYQDKHNVQFCDLVGLTDLAHENEYVQGEIVKYIKRFQELGVAGIRIDASKHIDAGNLETILSRVGSMFRFHEVISGAGEAVHPRDYFSSGSVTEFEYARHLAPNFLAEDKLQYLDTFGESWGLMPSHHAVVFLDNHDTQRGEAKLTYKNGALYTLANVFMLAAQYGYPKVMSSYYFDDHDQGPPNSPVHDGSGVQCGEGKPWVCEHRQEAIANMVAWRRTAGAAPMKDFQKASPSRIAFCRGEACVALNRDGGSWDATIQTSLPAGEYCNVIASDGPGCPKVTVGGDGRASFSVPPQGAVAIHVGKAATGDVWA